LEKPQNHPVGRDRPGFAQGYAGQAAARPLHFFRRRLILPALLPSKIQNPKSKINKTTEGL